MKTLFALITFALIQSNVCFASITKPDILKTVQHLQERCQEAETAQTAAQDHVAQLQVAINNLANQEQAAEQAKVKAEAKTAELQKANNTLSGRLDKLGLALAAVAGLFGWAIASKFATLLPIPWNLIGPVAAGVLVSAFVFSYLRFIL